MEFLPDCGHGLVCRSEFFASDIFRRIFTYASDSILARRVTSHACHAGLVLSPRIVRIIQGLAEVWHRLDERIDHLSHEIAALERQDAGCEGNAFSKGRDFACRLGDRFQNSNHGDRSKILQSPGTAISALRRSLACTNGICIVSVQCRHGARRLPARWRQGSAFVDSKLVSTCQSSERARRSRHQTSRGK